MNKLLGYDVEIHLKDGDVLSGMFFDVDEDSVYIKRDADVIVAIPKSNVKLYMGASISNVDEPIYSQPAQTPVVQASGDGRQRVSQDGSSNILNVYIDAELIAGIPVPPTLELTSFNDGIMRTILGSPDVQVILAARTQKLMEYEPGSVYIYTVEGANSPISIDSSTDDTKFSPPQASFAIGSGGGAMMDNFMNPSQMVGNLNDAVQRSREKKK